MSHKSAHALASFQADSTLATSSREVRVSAHELCRACQETMEREEKGSK
jgi:hypothetical protein